MVTYKIDLDVAPGGLPKVLHVKQYQTDALLLFRLHVRRGELSIGNVTDCSIRGTKTDGNGYSVSATYLPTNTTVQVQLTEQMTAVAGRQPYEITVTDSTGKMITATFYLDVQRAAFDLDTISDSEIRELTDALDHTDEILEAFNAAQYDDIPTAGSSKAVKSSGIKSVIDEIADGVTDLDNLYDIHDSKFYDITSETENFFDPYPFVGLDGISFANGIISGTLETIHNEYNETYYPVNTSFDASYYTLGLDAKIEGVTTGTGLIVKITYNDNTYTSIVVPNSTSEWSHFVVKTYKPVLGINFTYGSNGDNVVYIRNIMLVSGLTDKTYVPFLTAVDSVARKTIVEVDQKTDEVDQKIDVVDRKIDEVDQKNQVATYDYSGKTIGSTYVGVRMPVTLMSGMTYKFVITAPQNDENTEYFLFYKTDGDRLIPSGILAGRGSRTVTFENTYGEDAVIVEMVLAAVNAQSVYTVEFINSDAASYKVNELDDRVTVLENGSNPDMEVPDYFESNVAAAIAGAQNAMSSASINGETFVFLSDIHWENNEKHSPALVKAVTDALPIENTVYGGDTFNGETQEYAISIMNDVRQQFTKASPHFLSVYGNHDGNQLDGGTAFTHDEFYTFLQKQSDNYVEYEAPCYYYMDNKTTKTRYIVLDSRTGTPETASTQIAWLQRIINNAPSGWHFLVFCHVIFYPDTGGSYSDPTTWIMSPFMTSVCSTLDTLNNEMNDKKVEAMFGGHTHFDYDTTTSGGIPIIIIDCDTRQTVSPNPQTVGTIGEQCIDIVTVDYLAEKITCARIGRGSSRVVTY